MKQSRATAMRLKGWEKVRAGLNQSTTPELYKAVDNLIKENNNDSKIKNS